jgi:flagellar M-ring protein FliF
MVGVRTMALNQFTQLWNKLTWAQRTWIAVAAVAVIGGILALNHWNQERAFQPLFSGLAAEDAGTVTAKLRELGVEYRLSDDGSTILAQSDKIAEARLQLASAGLPKSGRIGFELFDKANFGASDFAEQVNYHRAIEGELERSVMSLREVEQARVHVTLAKDSLYTEQRQPAKASIVVKLRHAGGLSPQNVAAICQLTASAVPGLSPEQVSLVDTNGNLLNRPRANLEGEDQQATEAALEYRKSIERDVQSKIAQTLQPLLGADHFRAGVSADVDLTSADQSEEVYDPQKSVIVTSQTTQDGPGLPTASGIPGTPSNLPNPVSPPVLAAFTGNYARHTENITYQNSRVVKHTKLPQGTLTRLSMSVLVDHSLRWEGSRRVVEPPSAEKLKVIRDLVAAATGLDAKRGDQLVVEAFPFEATLTAEPLLQASPTAKPPTSLPLWLQELMAHRNFGLIAGIGGACILALLVGVVVLVRQRKKKHAVEIARELEERTAKELAAARPAHGSALEGQLADQSAEKARLDAEALMKLKFPVIATKKTDVLTKHIAAEARRDPVVMAQVVRSWLHGDNIRR